MGTRETPWSWMLIQELEAGAVVQGSELPWVLNAICVVVGTPLAHWTMRVEPYL